MPRATFASAALPSYGPYSNTSHRPPVLLDARYARGRMCRPGLIRVNSGTTEPISKILSRTGSYIIRV